MGRDESLYSTRTQNPSHWDSHWGIVQTRNFALGIQTCWYLKTLKFALPPTRILTFALPPTRNPNASQLNIGCVGSQTQISRDGHVRFMFFVSISFAFGNQRKPSFWWNMGYKLYLCFLVYKLMKYIDGSAIHTPIQGRVQPYSSRSALD